MIRCKKLKQAGIKEIIINIGWKGWKIPETLGDGSQWGVQLHYSDEQNSEPLETAGGIHKALPLLGSEPFIVINGDVWCDFTLENLQLAKDDFAHLVLISNPKHNPEGDFCLTNNRISEIGMPSYTFSGIGCYRAELFEKLLPGKSALGPLLRKTMSENKVSGELFLGEWRDIGTPERLETLNQELCKL